MVFDFKKVEKAYYQTKQQPTIVTIPKMQYLAVRGSGNPNDPEGEYPKAIEQLYGIAYTIKMSKKGSVDLPNYEDFVVPPLEGFWWQTDIKGYDATKKELFEWYALIRMPDFVTEEIVNWAKTEATSKKQKDYSKVELLTYEEGVCVQAVHIGPYDTEPETAEKTHQYAEAEGYVLDLSEQRHHYEIYYSDPRRTAPEKLKTLVRHPIRKV